MVRSPYSGPGSRGLALAAFGFGIAVLAGASPAASVLPPELVQRTIADSLDAPVSMAIAPDGRVFVCEQGGRLRVVRRGVLLERPAIEVPTRGEIEEGLLGIALAPEFLRMHRFYLLFTVATPSRHERIVRYTLSGDTVLAGSAHTVFDLDAHAAQVHLGGRMRFGHDGMLYVATGDQNVEALAQSLGSTSGKLLRIRRDGSIPADNPFFATTRDRCRAIWARGFRNAFGLAVDRRGGRMFVQDVGGSRFEEINEALAGANYGAPIAEGANGPPGFRAPLYQYDHSHGCAITGGAFYDPLRVSFSSDWAGRYFFCDYCSDEIRWLDPRNPRRVGIFAQTGLAGLVDLAVGPSGDLWALARGNSNPVGGSGDRSGVLVRISRAKN
jgi:glucose/arabinose dehydrogenase